MAAVIPRALPLTVALAGEIDILTSPATRHQLMTAVRAGHTTLIIDMTAVTFIDASGVNALTAVATCARRTGGHLALRGPSPQLRRIIGILHLAGVLPDAG